MGKSFSCVQEEKKRSNDFSGALKLREIEQSMRERLECVKAKLYIGALNDECLPIVCAVDKFYAFLFDVEFNDGTLNAEIKTTIEKHLSGDYLEELRSLIAGVLKGVLATRASHEPIQRLHVVLANRSVLRIDYYFYFERITPENTALLYYVQVGVIDMARVRLPVLQYELSMTMKDNKRRSASRELKNMVDDRFEEAIESYVKAVQGGGMFSRSNENGDDSGDDMVGGRTPVSRERQPTAFTPMEVS